MKSICKVEKCELRALSLGYCRKHYKRYRKYGNPEYLHNRICPNCKIEFGALYPHQKWCSEECKILGTRQSSWKKWYARNRDKHIENNSSYYKENKQEVLKRTKNWVEKRKSLDPEYHQKRSRKARYGISEEEFQFRLSEQNNACLICHIKFNLTEGKAKRAYVDHDHKTGQVRALLCHHCNLVIANADEKVETLENAIVYLEKNHDQ